MTATTFDDVRQPVPGIAALVAAVRAVTREPMDWGLVAERVAEAMRRTLPDVGEVLALVPPAARAGADQGQLVHVEKDGSFSIVALVTRPGQETVIHDHTTWCAVAVLAGLEREERFDPVGDGVCNPVGRPRTDVPGAVCGFAPPGDIHRVTNIGSDVGLSLNVYGTDVSRIGSSVRRTYRLASSRDASGGGA
jgi:predicted metal-dependent enzyme (double-stranded beta helix superfamily)